MTDKFVLMDEEGNVLVKKMMVSHIKVFLDEKGIEPGQKFLVKSKYTDCEFSVTESTTAQEWRDFSDKCEWALCDFEASIHVED